MEFVTLAMLREAQERLRGIAYHTPLIRSQADEGLYFKPETLQPIGSFKIRGAFNKIASLTPEERARGVIAYSSGNHAQGVAYAARALGIRAVVVMPTTAPQIKIESTRGYGAQVVLYDPLRERREEVAGRLQAEHGYALVPPFNDLQVIAGQGTIGLEIFADLPEVDLVLTPVGGGGLLSGTAAALKLLNPSVRAVGVEPEAAADAQASLKEGRIVTIAPQQAGRTLADGVRTLSVEPITFAHLQRFADAIVTVSETELVSAARRLILTHKLTVEPTAALPLAAYLYHRDALPPARNVVIVLSGGSVDPAQLARLIQSE
ncbi:MAG: threonine/serine dehydratase [Anaerolineae bacterium]|nr:threonine/serine dehydratase [Anaerolineae bacterium]